MTGKCTKMASDFSRMKAIRAAPNSGAADRGPHIATHQTTNASLGNSPAYIARKLRAVFRDPSHDQLQLFVERANSALG